jgi:hypothetical protein
MARSQRTIEEKTVTAEEFADKCYEMIELVAKRNCTFVITKEGRPHVKLQPVPRVPRLRKPADG